MWSKGLIRGLGSGEVREQGLGDLGGDVRPLAREDGGNR
jgi:hypothetical protein